MALAASLGAGGAGRSRGEWLFALPSLLLLFGMVFLPTAYQPWKAALVLLAAGVALGARLRSPLRTLHRDTLLWTIALVALGLAFMVRGLLRGEPGALRVGTVYALWPAAFAMLLAGAADDAVVRRHLVLFVGAVFAASLYGLEFVLEQGGWLARSYLPDVFPDQGVGFYEGYVELRLPSLAILPFALPFLIAAGMSSGRGQRPIMRRRFLWGALVAGLLLAALSGRRAVLLVVALAPLLTLALLALLPRGERRALLWPAILIIGVLALAVAVIGAFLGAFYGFDAGILWDEFRQGFDRSASESSSIRAEQLSELISAWQAHPLLGSGHGGFLRSHVRDLARPWSYELSYPALLFQTGALGFTLYAGLFAWIFWQAARMIRAGGDAGRTMLPVVVGLASFLIANGTNPYLLKFDFMWAVFLPLALVNRWLIRREGDVRGAPA